MMFEFSKRNPLPVFDTDQAAFFHPRPALSLARRHGFTPR
jgi:hypothetical protein